MQSDLFDAEDDLRFAVTRGRAFQSPERIYYLPHQKLLNTDDVSIFVVFAKGVVCITTLS
eukprot:scaffold516_cov175-Amphora_coffeaeformis.AAC.43